jgi:hypothetical protein
MPYLTKALAELIAIDSVRLELANAAKTGATQSELAEIHARLISLYAALDTHNVRSIIERIDYKRAA